MDQRKRSAFTVQFTTPGVPKTVLAIETVGGWILLVDVHGQWPEPPPGIVQQLRAHALATAIGVDEEHFHMAVAEADKTAHLPAGVRPHVHGHGWQVQLIHLAMQALDVLGTEKVMGGQHGAVPDIQEHGVVGR